MTIHANDVVIVDAVRSPMGKSKNGIYRNVRSENLSAELVKALQCFLSRRYRSITHYCWVAARHSHTFDSSNRC